MAQIMSFRIFRTRGAVGFAWKRNLRFLCTNAAPPSPRSAELSAAAYPSLRSFLKYAAVAALTGSTIFTSYALYAYSSNGIDEKTKAFRESAKQTATGNKGQGMAYSTAMAAIELYLDARKLIERNIRSYTEPYLDKLLPDLHPQERDMFTLVLDLDENVPCLEGMASTVETSWEPFKRPGVGAFLEHLAQFYEIVVYADEISVHVDAVIDRLDTKHCITHRLSRSATRYQDGKHFRDLSKLNRDPAKVLYLSAHALENCLQPDNCVSIKPCKQHDQDDTTLLDFIPFLESVALSSPADIRPVLQSYQGCDIPTEFIRRSKEHQR